MVIHVVPNYIRDQDLANFIQIDDDCKVFIIVFHILFLLTLWSMIKTMITNPGDVLKSWNFQVSQKIFEDYLSIKQSDHLLSLSGGNLYSFITKEVIKDINVYNKDFKRFLEERKIRFCKICNQFKPHRSHHCRQCSKCILKMDHHCNWLLNCIGFRNYKFFLQFITYCDVLLIFYSIHFTKSILWNDLLEQPSNGLILYLKSVNWLFILSSTFLLSLLNVLHWGILANNNKSTIEFCENKKDNGNYDQGWFKNFINVFGNNPFYWILPIGKVDYEDGHYFKQYESTNKEEEERLIF